MEQHCQRIHVSSSVSRWLCPLCLVFVHARARVHEKGSFCDAKITRGVRIRYNDAEAAIRKSMEIGKNGMNLVTLGNIYVKQKK